LDITGPINGCNNRAHLPATLRIHWVPDARSIGGNEKSRRALRPNCREGGRGMLGTIEYDKDYGVLGHADGVVGVAKPQPTPGNVLTGGGQMHKGPRQAPIAA
jgi:hypothetical protein